MDPEYLPFDQRKPDTQYRTRLRRILKEGIYTENPYQKNGTKTVDDLVRMSFDLRNGIPLITERKIGFWRKSIGEMLAFVNGARYLEDFERYGCANFWADSVTKEKCDDFNLQVGDLGPASYGPIFHDYPNFVELGGNFLEQPFNQFENLIIGIKEEPSLRTHMVTSWFPPGVLQHSKLQRKVVVAPCHGSLIKLTIFNGNLTLHHVQRSMDMIIGGPSNIFQYGGALTLMMAQLTGTVARKYVHTFLDAQMYVNHEPYLREMISKAREPRRFPTLRITDPTISRLSDFKIEHFELSDYDPHPAINGIPLTV